MNKHLQQVVVRVSQCRNYRLICGVVLTLMIQVGNTHAESPPVSPLPKLKAPTTAPTTRPALAAGIKAVRNLSYGPAGERNLLDVYLPENAQGKYPLIVWIHGGGWQAGSKEGCPAVPIVQNGYVVASINYRFSQTDIFPAQMHDCKGAIRWLRAHAAEYHIDTDHVGVGGASAGGHLAALIGTSGDVKEAEGNIGGNIDQSSKVHAVIDWYGPTDMSVFFKHAEGVENIFKANPEQSPITKLFGGLAEKQVELVRAANPISYISKDRKLPVFLIIHGDKDKLVPLAQSEILVDALKKSGTDVRLEVVKNAGHGDGFDYTKLRKMQADFADETLKNIKK